MWALSIEDSQLRKLTPREVQVAELLIAGMTYKEICKELGLKIGTIRGTIHTLYIKLEINSKYKLMLMDLEKYK